MSKEENGGKGTNVKRSTKVSRGERVSKKWGGVCLAENVRRNGIA